MWLLYLHLELGHYSHSWSFRWKNSRWYLCALFCSSSWCTLGMLTGCIAMMVLYCVLLSVWMLYTTEILNCIMLYRAFSVLIETCWAFSLLILTCWWAFSFLILTCWAFSLLTLTCWAFSLLTLTCWAFSLLTLTCEHLVYLS